MKRSILAFAVLALFGTATFASEIATMNFSSDQADKTEVLQQDQKMKHDQTMKHDYKTINVTELPDAVEKAVTDNEKEATIETAQVMVLTNGEKVYKVTFNTPDRGQKTKSFYANGNKYDKEE